MIPNAAALAVMVARQRLEDVEDVYTQQHNQVGRAVLEVLGTVAPLIQALEHVLRDPLTTAATSAAAAGEWQGGQR
jgi:hypothetical protein